MELREINVQANRLRGAVPLFVFLMSWYESDEIDIYAIYNSVL